MTIPQDKRCLVLRVNNFRGYDFIEEHRKELLLNGHVWMVKLGKMLSESKMDEIVENGGHIILKTPKKQNEAYYYAHLCEFVNGTHPTDGVYPRYYNDISAQEGLTTLSGTWMKVDTMQVIDAEAIQHLYLSSNGKKLHDIVNVTRTSYLFVFSDVQLSINDVCMEGQNE